ncbi:hypothetical protein [Mesobacillus harenae]|uniref:hypothetical protein n=1 Tax=Mesobacillus harenae TaxID=2213203 RepID=UPI00158068E4|nr:hypothetical protein [Mesobacillus harenae]
MAGLLVKILVCPITVIIASFLFPNVFYSNLLQPIIVGLVLAFSAHMMEIFILKEGMFWLSTIADFATATLIVYFVSLFFVTATVTVGGAILTGLLLAATEIVQHYWLIGRGRTEKSA